MYCRYPFETCIPFPLGVHTRWIYGSSMSHVIKSFGNTHLSMMPEPVCVPDCVSLPFLPYSSQDLFTFDCLIVAPLAGAGWHLTVDFLHLLLPAFSYPCWPSLCLLWRSFFLSLLLINQINDQFYKLS